MNKKVLLIVGLLACILLIVIIFPRSDVTEVGTISDDSEVSRSAADKVTPDPDTGKNEQDYSDYAEAEVHINDLSEYLAKAASTYHAVMGDRLKEYGEVRFSGYVVGADRDNNPTYEISDSSEGDDGVRIGNCWTYEMSSPENGYAIGDYVTVQGYVDYNFARGTIFIGCSFIEKGEKRFEAHYYDASKPYTNTTVSEIKNNMSAAIASLETMLPRKRLIKTSGYFVRGPSIHHGFAVGLSKDRIENWDQGIHTGHTCYTGPSNDPLDQGLRTGDYVTWWIYFSKNFSRHGYCVLAKIEKTPKPDHR